MFFKTKISNRIFWLFGFINYLIPLILPLNGHRIVKDEQFFASVRMVGGMFLVPLWFLYFFLLGVFLTKQLGFGLVYLLLVFLAGWVMIRNFHAMKWLRKAFKMSALWKQKEREMLTLRNLNSHIRDLFRVAGFDLVFEIQ